MPTLLKVKPASNTTIVHVKAFTPSFICGVRLNSTTEVHLGIFEGQYCLFFNNDNPVLIKRYVFPRGFGFAKAREIFSEYVQTLQAKPYLLEYAIKGMPLDKAQAQFEAERV
jgi:hypothetical protein